MVWALGRPHVDVVPGLTGPFRMTSPVTPALGPEPRHQHSIRCARHQEWTGLRDCYRQLGRLPAAQGSDNLIDMRTVTATEASRCFAAILDEAERGHAVVVTRSGRRIATIGPAMASNGAEVLALLDANPTDGDFAADVLAAREAVALEGPAWPAD